MTGSTDTSPRPGGLVTGAAVCAGTEIGLDRAVTGSAVPYIPAAQAALIAAALTFAAIMRSFAAMSRHSA
jgi:hypothetical protein